MIKTKFFLYLILVLQIQILGCAMAPLNGSYSAKPLGVGNSELSGIVSVVHLEGEPTAVPLKSVRFLVGISENTDLGITADESTTTLLGKYSFSSESSGVWRKAFLGGLTRISSTNGWSLGLLNSFYFSSWEPTLLIRLYDLSINPADFDFKYVKNGDTGPRRFWYANIGVKYWFKQNLSLGFDMGFLMGSQGATNTKGLPLSGQKIGSLTMGFVF